MKTRPLVTSESQPRASLGFQWAMGVAAIILSTGGVLDNWAHFHGLVDQSFFTPWHAVMYAMMATLGIVLGTLALVNVRKGYRFSQSLPAGYMLSLAGVLIFIVAGCLDLLWHTIFGIEKATEAFVSPTHIFLCAGGLLAGTGPLRDAYLALTPATTRGWRLLGPMLLSATGVLIAIGIFAQFMSPMNDVFAAKNDLSAIGTNFYNTQSFGIAEAIVQTVLLMSMMLVLVRTWSLPFGAITLIIATPSMSQLIMRDHYVLIASVIGTGLIADLLLLRLRPPLEGARLYIFAASVPALYEISMFLTFGLTVGLQWSVNMVAGSALYTSATGLFLAFLIDWPVKRSTATHESKSNRRTKDLSPPLESRSHPRLIRYSPEYSLYWKDGEAIGRDLHKGNTL